MQVLEAEELEGLLYAELQRTPKHGTHFCAAVRTILTRETQCAPPLPVTLLRLLLMRVCLRPCRIAVNL